MSKPSIVWITGAGFSRSLGAPLLADLFSQESIDTVVRYYSARDWSAPLATEVGEVYRAGAYEVGFADQQAGSARMWPHAEEFLAQLDKVRSGDQVLEARVTHFYEKRLNETLNQDDLNEFCRAAHRLLAAECTLFTEGVSLGEDGNAAPERWRPYVRWARRLHEDDTVITFNYDLVPDFLSALADQNLDVVLPGDEKRQKGVTPVYKMHGGVNWEKVEDGTGRPLQKAEKPCFQDEKDAYMATPGAAKLEMVTGSGLLVPLWEHAKETIENARAIVLIGYSFPPTDAYTREFLLDAIGQRESPAQVHVVLGPNTRSEIAMRLRSLLMAAASPFVCAWPMFAEDFIERVSREQILRPQINRPTGVVRSFDIGPQLATGTMGGILG